MWVSGFEKLDQLLLVMAFSWLDIFLGGYLVEKRCFVFKCFHGALPVHGFYHVLICGFTGFLASKPILMESSLGQKHGNTEK